jgi:hypothetical protein
VGDEVAGGGAGFVVAFSVGGTATADDLVALAETRTPFAGVREGVAATDGLADSNGIGLNDGSTSAAGTVGTVGSTMTGARRSSVGPTARTATHATRTTRSVAAPPMKPIRRTGNVVECLPGNGGPFALGVGRGEVTRQSIPLLRRPIARLISFCASRVARSWRLS